MDSEQHNIPSRIHRICSFFSNMLSDPIELLAREIVHHADHIPNITNTGNYEKLIRKLTNIPNFQLRHITPETCKKIEDIARMYLHDSHQARSLALMFEYEIRCPRLPVPPVTTRPIIEQEFEKLIALDPDLAEYEFNPAFICPISNALMLDPVIVVESGSTYDRNMIETWFKKSNLDPLTHQRLPSKKLISNMLVKQQILACLTGLQLQAKNTTKIRIC